MGKLVFVNRFFYPDLSATSQMLTDLAVHLAANGRTVMVVTSRQSYEDPAIAYSPRETVFGIDVVRVATSRFGRAKLLGRSLDYLTFYLAVFWTLLRLVKQGDIVVAKTDPPLVSVIAALVAHLKGALLVNWLQDIFPEVGAALGVGVLSGLPGRCIQMARDASLRAAAANVVLGERMATFVRSRKVPSQHVHVIPNWADDVNIVPLEHVENRLRQAWFRDEEFVVAYSGNLGRAHDAQTILDAAVLLQSDARITFAFIGGGARMGEVRRLIDSHQLKNVEILSYQPRENLASSLGAADLHLVSLRPELEGYIVPSKFYGIAAAGRPIAFVGDPDGEIARLVAQFGCGSACRPGDSAALAEFIVFLADNPKMGRQMGINARLALEQHFSQNQLFQRWSNLLGRLEIRPM